MGQNNTLYKQAIILGVTAGMRTFTPHMVLSHFLSRQPVNTLAITKLKYVQWPGISLLAKILTIAETVGDKLPATPNRTGFPQILGRIGSGALAGAILYKATGMGATRGVLLGASSALVSSFAFFYLRQYIGQSTKLNDKITGAAEDIIAAALAVWLLSKHPAGK